MGSKKWIRIKVTYIDELGIPVNYKYFSKEKIAKSILDSLENNKFFNLIKCVSLEKYDSKIKKWVDVK